MTCMESQIHPQQGRTHGDTKFRGMISSLNHGGCRPSSGVGQTHSVSVVPHPSGTSGPPHTRGAYVPTRPRNTAVAHGDGAHQLHFATSHVAHELREGTTADATKAKRGGMVRRSTPYAFHDGTVGLYFMGFCREQAPMRERMEAIYGQNGQVRDALTDYSTPASGSYYFAPSAEALEAALA